MDRFVFVVKFKKQSKRSNSRGMKRNDKWKIFNRNGKPVLQGVKKNCNYHEILKIGRMKKIFKKGEEM